MSLQKIIGWIALLIAAVGAFTTIPKAAAILVVLGLIGGFGVTAETHVRVLVSALVLAALGGALGSIPGIGTHLVAIVGNVAIFVTGAALCIVFRNIYQRFKP